ncbi:MAG: uncharacterized protein KVP18_001560 [Porospora cf. gigantea A]|nr:MAG: hypothetical protein KVP18_001560 [Porospora cf. gigantea A]
MKLFALVAVSMADLQVNCNRRTTEGVWTLHLGSFTEKNCGYERPDNPSMHERLQPDQLGGRFNRTTTLTTRLEKDNSASSDPFLGSWTLIFNEGVEIRLEGRSLFAFFSHPHRSETDAVTCDCSRTLLGWWHDKESAGCWWGEKISELDGSEVDPKAHLRSMDTYSPRQERLLLKPQVASHLIPLARHFRSRINVELSDRRVLGPSPAEPDITILSRMTKFSWADAADVKVRLGVDVPIIPTRLPAQSCGSCYVDTGVVMASARARIKLVKDPIPRFSMEDLEHITVDSRNLLSCSAFNQGCHGGYTFLVFRQAQIAPLYLNKCLE